MKQWQRNLTAAVLAVGLLAAGCGERLEMNRTFDLVIQGGRVMDPESGLDGVRNIGVKEGRIEVISQETLDGSRVIEASGLVVAPGFIDLHEHGQTDEAYRLMVQDGVTSAFELEVGTADVAGWYRERAGGQFVHYGVSIGHIPVRMKVMDDPGEFLPAGPAAGEQATAEQLAEIRRRLAEGLAQGAVAVGAGAAYTPGASEQELGTVFQVAAEQNANVHIHVGEGLQGLQQAIDLAAQSGALLHVVHINSSGGAATADYLALIEQARERGQDVTTEAYPYEAGMTSIQSAFFDDWESWEDQEFSKFQWVDTGERLTRETFGRYRKEGGNVIIHSRTEEMTQTAIASPLTMIASDGFLADGKGHPRTSGTYAKVLGTYVREKGVLTLMEALRKMTIAPARRLEERVPQMKKKGRLQPGADADLTLFDPQRVRDRATFSEPTLPSAAIEYVVVGGEVVVDGGELQADRKPGAAIRAQETGGLSRD